MPTRKRARISSKESGDALTASNGDALTKLESQTCPIMRIPKEVSEEIAKYLTPGDLLRLARTSKSWRAMLMSKTSKRIWVASRQIDEVPDCPDDMTEPQFAALLYETECTRCPSSRKSEFEFFELRLRLCNECKATRVFPVRELVKMHPHSAIDELDVLLPMLPTTVIKYGCRGERFVFKDQYEAELRNLRALPPDSDERTAYITERREAAKSFRESAYEMKIWCEEMPEHRESEIMKEHRASVLCKLKAIGYRDEDLDETFDSEDWEWQTLLDRGTSLTEESWEEIRPRLVQTIELRREHLAPMFYAHRRQKREDEVKQRFALFKPQLETFARHKLFLKVDFLELPVVKDLTEEDNCRIPLTDERWLTVQNTLVENVQAHARRIEEDCLRVMDSAKDDAISLTKERWYERECREWEEREEEREKEREAHENDPDASDYESVIDTHPGCLEEPTQELLDIEDAFDFDDGGLDNEEDTDLVNPRLLSAQSLFQQEINGLMVTTSYADILRKRASRFPLPMDPLSYGEPIAWCNEKITSSGEIVDTAARLLKALKLSVRTKMAYTEACGEVFRCGRCFSGPITKGVTWPALVQHFVYEYERYNELRQKNSELNSEVPLLNDHSLEVEEYRAQGLGIPVSMPMGLKGVAGGPFTNTGHRYTEMAATWGIVLPPGILNMLNADRDEHVGIPWGDLGGYDSSDDWMFDPDIEYEDVYTEKCKLCAKLGVSYAERTQARLGQHMKRRHGTDLKGDVLGGSVSKI